MKKQFLYLSACMLALASCSSENVIENFENGIANWTIEGEAFTNTSSDSDLTGFVGNSYLRSAADDSATGSAVSAPFTIEKNFINMLVAGPKAMMGRSAVSVSLVVGGETVLTGGSISTDPNTFEWVSWDVAQYKGKTGVIKVDATAPMSFGTRRMARGFIAVDQISQSNKRLSTFLDEYKVTLKADKKYILIPAANNGSNSRLSVNVGGENILGLAQSAKPAADRIDYYIPVNVEKYAGQQVEVVLTGVKTTDAVYGAICTSDDTKNVIDEQFRPLVHFAPQFGWTNDPNGMVRTPNGEWHLSLQYNPYGTSHGNMHWGLSVSNDLMHWNDAPAIIAPDELGSIFSGSAVVDHNNTSGFGKDAIVAIYTSAGQGQRQSIAYSTDGGYTFTKYDKNPVLADPEQRDFRDPKVSWVKDQWVMVLAVGQVVRFYGSPDLKSWTLLSEFGEGIGSHASVWECPDLFKLNYNGEEKWVLFVSITGPNNANNVQYFVGDFDGKEFHADPLPYPLFVDGGVNQYASVTWGNAPDNRRVFLGWLTSSSFGQGEPVTKYYAGGMTLPRELSLKSNGKHVILASTPSPEIYKARYDAKDLALEATAEAEISTSYEGAYEVDLTLKPTGKGQFGFTLSNAKGEEVVYTFDPAAGKIYTDRSNSGINAFSPRVSSPIESVLPVRDEYKVELFIDKTSSEMFINDGDVVITNCVFPTEYYNKIKVFGATSAKDSKVYGIK